jgi:hypothetical protein
MSTQSESIGVGGTSDQGRKKGESIEEMLLRLGIEEDVADDLVFEEEEDAPKEGLSGWLLLAFIQIISLALKLSSSTCDMRGALQRKCYFMHLRKIYSQFSACVSAIG